MSITNEPVAAVSADRTVAEDAPAAGRLRLAVAAGLGAAAAGAALWAVVTVASKYELGIMAIAVGFMVGKAVSAVAHSRNPAFGIVGAACSLAGCVLGNLLSGVGFLAAAGHLGYFEALSRLDPAIAIRLMTAMFSPMDLIFYAIGIYEGYRFSVVR
ncbi:MAG TPA: hypothetical protein VGG10_15560 [Rhizomicrobium sp.]|jgi:hypothetical protein